MGIGLAASVSRCDRERRHPAAEHGTGHPRAGIGQEPLGPALEAKTIQQDQISAFGGCDISGRGFITVNFSPLAGDRVHLEPITSHLAGQIRQHGETGEYQGPSIAAQGFSGGLPAAA